jgi:hypothetical protein
VKKDRALEIWDGRVKYIMVRRDILYIGWVSAKQKEEEGDVVSALAAGRRDSLFKG